MKSCGIDITRRDESLSCILLPLPSGANLIHCLEFFMCYRNFVVKL